MECIIGEAEKQGAKVVLVGDSEQLQAIEADAAFRSIAERHGSVEITDIRRQHNDWQRDATRHLATGRTGEAVRAYEERGAVHAAETREQARVNLIDGWDRDRQARPDATSIILTHMASDYTRDFADRRAIIMPLPAIAPKEREVPTPFARARGMFDGLQLRVAPIVGERPPLSAR